MNKKQINKLKELLCKTIKCNHRFIKASIEIDNGKITETKVICCHCHREMLDMAVTVELHQLGTDRTKNQL